MRRVRLVATLLAVAVGIVSTATPVVSQSPAPEPPTLVKRFLDGTGTPMTSYRARRMLEAEARDGAMHASLIADTSFDPAIGFQYTIVSEDGSGLIRSRVLRAALEAEKAMYREGDSGRGAFTPQNYDFIAPTAVEDGLVAVEMHPKRSDKFLIAGRMLLSEADAELVRVEGVLVKRPSFWTRHVDVVQHYARLHGVRVPVAMRSIAKVLMVGTSSFSMTYDYESINGDPIR